MDSLSSYAYYVTHYSHNGKAREYRTKKLTAFHEHIRKVYSGAYTVRCNPAIPFPLGVYTEVLFRPGNVRVSPPLDTK